MLAAQITAKCCILNASKEPRNSHKDALSASGKLAIGGSGVVVIQYPLLQSIGGEVSTDSSESSGFDSFKVRAPESAGAPQV
ncbi:GM10822 [Drosophila sechellia]|uniref:GM10822 n=1 Tax=Drosophila sechellia TaxID=7238 RepID=B4I441_DROSE|nr:GM10822 [Drosophila sechellia]